jgi:cytidine deaminase
MNDDSRDPEPGLELIFAVAGPVGSDLQEISRTLGDALRKSEYAEVEEISVTTLIRQIAERVPLTTSVGASVRLLETPEEMRIASHMDAGNAIRRLASNPAAIATASIAEIRGIRKRHGSKPGRRAYIIRSLKRPEEAHLLRRVYGPGFFLIGVNVNRPERVDSLARRIARSHNETPASPRFPNYLLEAEALAQRDEDEATDEYGQRLRDVFQLCDLFVSPTAATSLFDQIDRFVRLILGDMSETPCRDEQFMFQAFATSLASGALGRQVGAVIVSATGEVLGVGWNDVPKGGGGLYRAGEHYDRRDIHEERDSVNVHADLIIDEMLETARDAGWLSGHKPRLDEAREAMKRSRVMSLLEFGRTSHAEVEAVLAAARIGASPRDATLYTTTFPCHQCARLIVTAGVRKVVYIEPYPKSRALELHRDAIFAYDDTSAPRCDTKDCDVPHAVRFEPFLGIGPHRFVDLFSMTTSAGITHERKVKTSGERIRWNPKTSRPKVEMLPLSYLDLEAKALYQLKKFLAAEAVRR